MTDLTLNTALGSLSTLNWTLYIVSILYPINCLPFIYISMNTPSLFLKVVAIYHADFQMVEFLILRR